MSAGLTVIDPREDPTLVQPVVASATQNDEGDEEDKVAEKDDEEEALNISAEIDVEEALARALSSPKLLTVPSRSVLPPAEEFPVSDPVEAAEEPAIVWPPVFDEETALSQQGPESWPDLSDTGGEANAAVELWVRLHGKILVRVVTWNLAAKPPPPSEFVAKQVLPPNRYHVYIVGTEECERSIASSALNTSKRGWEEYLALVLGPNYVPLRAHTLQAIHLIAFVHKSIAPLCSEVTSAAVATGIANTLGNKGGVAISLNIGSTKFVFASAHLAAHQNAVKKRNTEYEKLRRELPVLLAKKEAVIRGAGAPSQPQGDRGGGDTTLLESCADRVVFLGDLNYRVRGNRKAVDQLLHSDMHDVMLANDQLKWSMRNNLVLAGFTEPPLNFRPTYKFDFNSSVYDTGSKQRIPAWADRILYVQRGLRCLSYNADFSLQTSDHRPVYATFLADFIVEPPESYSSSSSSSSSRSNSNTTGPAYTSESQVCTIM